MPYDENKPPVSMNDSWNPIRMIADFLRSQRTEDIELEPESGIVDPQLPGQTGAQLRKAFDIANRYSSGKSSGLSAIDALRQAGKR